MADRTRVFRPKARKIRLDDFVMPTFYNGYSPDGFVVTAIVREHGLITLNPEGENFSLVPSDTIAIERTYPSEG